MSVTKVNLNGIMEMDFNLAGTTTAVITSPSVVEITNTPPSGGPGSVTVLDFLNVQSAVVGNGTPQPMYSFTIPTNTIPIGGAVRLTFLTFSSSGITASNGFSVTLGSSTMSWNTTSDIPSASGSVVISNDGATNLQNVAMYPLIIYSAGAIAAGSPGSFTEDTTTPLVISINWDGPATQSTQLIQASLELLIP